MKRLTIAIAMLFFATAAHAFQARTGQWWNSNESGSGYNIDIQNGVLVVTVFSYEQSGESTTIDVRAPYYLLGTQRLNEAFWSLPRLKEVGIVRLSDVGVTWPASRSISTASGLVSHLTYCYHCLRETAPTDSIPAFCIG